MNKIANGVLNHKRMILIILIVAVAVGVMLIPMVSISYSLSDYLPDRSPSTKALKVLEESFAEDLPNVNVYIPEVSIAEALKYKEKLEKIPGISSVLWLDDVMDVQKPLEMENPEKVEAWYKDGGALMLVTADINSYDRVIDEIRDSIPGNSMMSGEAVMEKTIQTSTMNEISKIMLYAIPLVLVVLLISTSSWFEPVLFLITIGAAIALNEGTNIFLGKVSFITRGSSALLQLAVSIDYAVFLLHSFARFRRESNDIKEAMKKAMVESSATIAASAATTIFGFLALTLMKFKIGMDMGLVLAKGVFFSYISVIILLPVLAMYTTKIMDKTHHRRILPSFGGFARVVSRVCIPIAIIIVLIVFPSFLAQRNNQFVYGSSGMHGGDSELKKQADYINGIFGETQQMALLVPEGNERFEAALTEDLSSMPRIKSVISYSNTVGTEIPSEFLADSQLSQFKTNGYDRIIMYADTPDEGEDAFALVEAIRKTAEGYYGDNYYLLGQSVINYDLKEVIVRDYLPVTLASVLAIGMVLFITFRSVSLPLILLFTIESAIWINMALPYFTGGTMNYIGYQIVSAVQLGATVDYGILLAGHYLRNRKHLEKRESAMKSISDTAASILSPAGILTIAGITLGAISTNGIISQLGLILGRGAAISAGMVLLFLPACLVILDGFIQKTTLSGKGVLANEKKKA